MRTPKLFTQVRTDRSTVPARTKRVGNTFGKQTQFSAHRCNNVEAFWPFALLIWSRSSWAVLADMEIPHEATRPRAILEKPFLIRPRVGTFIRG